MRKVKYVKYPRSIVRKRQDHPSSLFVTIPKKIVKEWNLTHGQIIEFSTLVESEVVFVKLRKISAGEIR